MKRLKKQENETRLERVVRIWMNNHGRDYGDGWQGAYKDLEHCGCSSGLVNKLIFYHDTTRFYNRYKVEINELLTELLDSTGNSLEELFGERWDTEDPLVLGTNNQNLMAWFGFEEAARNVAHANGYEQ